MMKKVFFISLLGLLLLYGCKKEPFEPSPEPALDELFLEVELDGMPVRYSAKSDGHNLRTAYSRYQYFSAQAFFDQRFGGGEYGELSFGFLKLSSGNPNDSIALDRFLVEGSHKIWYDFPGGVDPASLYVNTQYITPSGKVYYANYTNPLMIPQDLTNYRKPNKFEITSVEEKTVYGTRYYEIEFTFDVKMYDTDGGMSTPSPTPAMDSIQFSGGVGRIAFELDRPN